MIPTEVDSGDFLPRNGNRFVFQVDESSILDIKYEPGRNGRAGHGKFDPNLDAAAAGNDKMNASSPLAKRQRHENNEEDGSSRF